MESIQFFDPVWHIRNGVGSGFDGGRLQQPFQNYGDWAYAGV
jgi:hypothetical protein